MYTGQVIKSKSIDKNLEIIFVDDLTEELICIELNSCNGQRYKVKFSEILEG